MDCGVDGAGGVGFDSTAGGGLSTVGVGWGVEEDGIYTWGCTEGVEGACWGVGMRGTGGVRE
jgi:hypothetical protein